MGADRLHTVVGSGGMMLRTAAFLLLMAAPAYAGELRPLDDTTLCLDGGTEVQPSINRVQLATCNDGPGQNVRRGKEQTIYVGQLCLQAVSVTGSGKIEIAAMRCHGKDGQRWILTRDGRLSSGQKLCLSRVGTGAASELLMQPCKTAPEDMSEQKWAIYGKFD